MLQYFDHDEVHWPTKYYKSWLHGTKEKDKLASGATGLRFSASLQAAIFEICPKSENLRNP